LKNFAGEVFPENRDSPGGLPGLFGDYGTGSAAAAAVTAAVVAAAAAVIAAAIAAGAGIAGAGAAAAEEDDEDEDDPQAAAAAPTVIATHIQEPPVKDVETGAGLSSSYARGSQVCITGTDFPGWSG